MQDGRPLFYITYPHKSQVGLKEIGAALGVAGIKAVVAIVGIIASGRLVSGLSHASWAIFIKFVADILVRSIHELFPAIFWWMGFLNSQVWC